MIVATHDIARHTTPLQSDALETRYDIAAGTGAQGRCIDRGSRAPTACGAAAQRQQMGDSKSPGPAGPGLRIPPSSVRNK